MGFEMSNKIDYNQININMIYKILDSIENKKHIMAHDIPGLSDKLKEFQDGKLRPIYFINYLSKFFDELNK